MGAAFSWSGLQAGCELELDGGIGTQALIARAVRRPRWEASYNTERQLGCELTLLVRGEPTQWASAG